MATAAVILTSSPVLADEYGVEKEAPTLFTGETVLVCAIVTQCNVKRFVSSLSLALEH